MLRSQLLFRLEGLRWLLLLPLRRLSGLLVAFGQLVLAVALGVILKLLMLLLLVGLAAAKLLTCLLLLPMSKLLLLLTVTIMSPGSC